MVFYSRDVYLNRIRITPCKKIKFPLIACMSITFVTIMFQCKEFRRIDLLLSEEQMVK